MTTHDRDPASDIDVSNARGATSVLVLAPQMDETTNRVCHRLLQSETDDQTAAETAVIKVSYHFSLSEIADRWAERNPDSQARLHCLSITDNDSNVPQTYDDNISFATARAEDLTGIGMKINQIVGELRPDDPEILVCLDSIDPMLMYADENTVYRFVRTITNFLSSNNARIHFHIDPSRSEEMVNTLRSAVNAVVEVDETGEVTVKKR